MRHLASAIVGLSLLGGAARATTTSEPQVWQGTAYIASITAACTSGNAAAVGDFYTLVYRPIIAGSAANTGNEGLTFVGSRNILHYFTPENSNQSFRTAGTASITYIDSHAESPKTDGSGAYSLKFTPAVPALSSSQIFISGKLQNFWDTKGCTVSFTASLDRRID